MYVYILNKINVKLDGQEKRRVSNIKYCIIFYKKNHPTKIS